MMDVCGQAPLHLSRRCRARCRRGWVVKGSAGWHGGDAHLTPSLWHAYRSLIPRLSALPIHTHTIYCQGPPTKRNTKKTNTTTIINAPTYSLAPSLSRTKGEKKKKKLRGAAIGCDSAMRGLPSALWWLCGGKEGKMGRTRPIKKKK